MLDFLAAFKSNSRTTSLVALSKVTFGGAGEAGLFAKESSVLRSIVAGAGGHDRAPVFWIFGERSVHKRLLFKDIF
jgi:hypothetical protein